VLGAYPHWFYLPAGIVFGVIFVIPTILSFYYSLTRWTLFETEFIGLDNYFLFFQEPALTSGLRNTIVYAVVTSGLKVVIGLLLATLLTSRIRLRNLLRSIVFFPVLVSTVAVGITFAVLLHPSDGLVNLVGWVTGESSFVTRRLQTGLVQNYALLMLFGVFAFLAIYWIAG